MELNLIKTLTGLIPADPDSEDRYNKLKTGGVVTAEVKQVRNAKFLRKYFALLNIGFDNWTPGKIDSRYGVPEKSFDRFRKDTTILAGYYHIVIRLDGSVKPEADSISFANMDEETFEKLYNATINVFLKHIYNSDMTRDKLDNMVNQVLSFT
jgi:hypothetical protein